MTNWANNIFSRQTFADGKIGIGFTKDGGKRRVGVPRMAGTQLKCLQLRRSFRVRGGNAVFYITKDETFKFSHWRAHLSPDLVGFGFFVTKRRKFTSAEVP